MAYNRKNLLKRIIEVQEITMREKDHGASQLWIYNNIIAGRFLISYATYNRYLTIAARKELKQLQNSK